MEQNEHEEAKALAQDIVSYALLEMHGKTCMTCFVAEIAKISLTNLLLNLLANSGEKQAKETVELILKESEAKAREAYEAFKGKAAGIQKAQGWQVH